MDLYHIDNSTVAIGIAAILIMERIPFVCQPKPESEQWELLISAEYRACLQQMREIELAEWYQI